jgi:hypothetical protein
MRPSAAPTSTGDRHWHGSARFATACTLTFAALTLVVDWETGALWLTLSATVLAVLLPQRVTAGPGWLAAQGLTGRSHVHTDSLVSIRQYGDISSLLVLRDTHGNRLELDPRVLVTNPLLWHELDMGARHSLASGTLHHGTDVLRHLAHEIDDETALSLFKASRIS